MFKVTLPITLLVLLCLSSIGVVLAQNQIGVSIDDSFTYSVTSNSNIPQIYQLVNQPKDVQWLKVTVIDIIAPNTVQLNLTQHYKNGTETSVIQNKDLTSAQNFPMTFSNLNVNDKLWSAESQSPTINETINQTFSTGVREINHASIGPQEYGYDLVDFNIDKQTGMPIKLSYIESQDYSTVLELIESNKSIIPEYSFMATIILLATLTFMTAAIAIKKQKFNKLFRF